MPDVLRLSEGELKSGDSHCPSILADVLGVIFEAVFFDGGFDATRTLIHRLYIPILEQVDLRTLGRNVKTLL